MPQIPPGHGIIRWEMTDISNNHEYLCQMGVVLAAADPLEVQGDAGQAWQDYIAPFVGQECTNGVCRLLVGTSDPSEPITYGGVIYVPGSSTADTAPPNVALLMKKRTGQGGRRNTGRMFVPKPTEAGIDEAGRLSSGQFAAWEVACSDFYDALVAIPGVQDLVILHRLVTEAPTVITSLEGQQLVASQRKRLRR